MSRISLVEAYDNRDVIGQLVRLREDVNEMQNILKDIDPDGDLTNVVTKTGDQTIDGIKTFVGKIVADCDIIQNGAAYETHAEQVYSVNDYIVTRDGQITGLGPGELSGFHVKKYNGVDDSRLGVDSSGTMRVGDVGSEQPLMTRDEVADLTSGNILLWDGVNEKAITSNKAVSDLVEGSGNIGDDTHPVKIVNGEAVAVTATLQSVLSVSSEADGTLNTATTNSGSVKYKTYGKMVMVKVDVNIKNTSTWTSIAIASGLPTPQGSADLFNFQADMSANPEGWLTVSSSGNLNLSVRSVTFDNTNIRTSFMYFSQ